MNLSDLLTKDGIKNRKNVDTSKISTIRAGGYVKLGIYPKNTVELVKAMEMCRFTNVRVKIIGGCSNTFFKDGKYDGAVIFTKEIKEITFGDGYVAAECGCTLARMLRAAADAGYAIANPLFGIPGTVGGAVRNNAGAFGCEIGEVFVDGCFLNTDTFEIITLSKNNLNFAYRYSEIMQKPLLFLSGRFRTVQSDRLSCLKDFSKYARIRRSKQPNLPSLGSFFKRCGNIIPAELIDLAGMKNYRIMDAAISDKHAGFIVNIGAATAKDIDDLAKTVEHRIKTRFNAVLVREAELVE